jgi:hypothetical protein
VQTPAAADDWASFGDDDVDWAKPVSASPAASTTPQAAAVNDANWASFDESKPQDTATAAVQGQAGWAKFDDDADWAKFEG